jgi:RNA recognition motif-containing protein
MCSKNLSNVSHTVFKYWILLKNLLNENNKFSKHFSIVEFGERRGLDYALEKLDGTDLDGRRIKLVEEKRTSRRSRTASRSRCVELLHRLCNKCTNTKQNIVCIYDLDIYDLRSLNVVHFFWLVILRSDLIKLLDLNNLNR